MDFIIFAVSMVMLITSVFYTRLFSILFWSSSAFAVLSLALLGLAAAGLLVYFKPDFFPREKSKQRIAWLIPSYAISLPVSYFGILATSKIGERFIHSIWNFLPASSMAVIPFFMGGLIVALILSRFYENVSRLYFWDMLGASLGALIALGMIYMCGTHTIIVLGLIIAVTAMAAAYVWRERSALIFSIGVALCLTAFGTLPSLEQYLTITFAKGEQEPYSPFEIWAPAARIKVLGDIQDKHFQLDSGVITPILPFNGNFKTVEFLKKNILQLAYHLGPYEKVVIIGPGGGSDVLSALASGNKNITAVEINSGIVRLMKHRLAPFTGNLYLLPGVEVDVGEGRSFLAHTQEKINLIQATFIDTYAASASGAHTLNESYLYTTDAIHDYLDKLNDDGIISISRWGGSSFGYTETYRTVAIAERALQENGVQNPQDHIIVVQGPAKELGLGAGYQGYGSSTADMATILISKAPFNEERLKILRNVMSRNGFRPLWFPGNPLQNTVIKELFEAKGSDQFYKDHYQSRGLDISPPTDNWPFFFSMLRPVDFPLLQDKFPWNTNAVYSFRYVPIYALHQMFFALSMLVGVLIALPLLVRRRDILPIARTKYHLLYFICLGLGFMGIELGLMQKFSLFLGHPVYALVIVLAALLFFSSLGSLASERIKRDFPLWASRIAFLLVFLLFTCTTFVPPLLKYCIAFPFFIKAIMAICIILPQGFLMGTLYPLGIKSLGNDKDTLIPWMWGLNTGFSVLASVLSLYLAMSYGFTFTWYVFVTIYLAAAICMVQLGKTNPA